MSNENQSDKDWPVQGVSLESQSLSHIASSQELQSTTNIPAFNANSSKEIVATTTSSPTVKIRNDEATTSYLENWNTVSITNTQTNIKKKYQASKSGYTYWESLQKEQEEANAKKNQRIPKLQKLTNKIETDTQKQKSKKIPKLDIKKREVKKESPISSESEIEKNVLQDESDADEEIEMDNENYCCMCNGYYFDK